MSSGWGWGIGPGPASPPGRRDFVSSHAGAQRGFAVRRDKEPPRAGPCRPPPGPALPPNQCGTRFPPHMRWSGAGRVAEAGVALQEGGGELPFVGKKRQRPSLSTNAPLLVRAPRVGVAARAPPGRPRRPGLWVTDQTLVGTHRPWGPGRRRGGPPFSMASVFFLGGRGSRCPIPSFSFSHLLGGERPDGRAAGLGRGPGGGDRGGLAGEGGGHGAVCVWGGGGGEGGAGTEVWGLFLFRSQRRTEKIF